MFSEIPSILIERLEKQLLSPGLSELTIQAEQIDQAVEWCVLGMLRQLYILKEHSVTSKVGAGLYGFKVLSERWHGLIHEAVAIKRREPQRVYESQLNRLNDLVAILRLIHIESNRAYYNHYERGI